MAVQNATVETDNDTSTGFRTLPGWLPGDPGDFYGHCGLGPRGPAAALGQNFGAVDAFIISVRKARGVVLQAKFARHESNGCIRLALTLEAFADNQFVAVPVDGVHRVVDDVLAARLRLE